MATKMATKMAVTSMLVSYEQSTPSRLGRDIPALSSPKYNQRRFRTLPGEQSQDSNHRIIKVSGFHPGTELRDRADRIVTTQPKRMPRPGLPPLPSESMLTATENE